MSASWIEEATRKGKHRERERGRERGYVSPNTGTISSVGREERAGERVAGRRESEVCAERVQ